MCFALSVVCSFRPAATLTGQAAIPARSVDLDGPDALALENGILYIAEGFKSIRRVNLRAGSIDTLQTSRPLESVRSLKADHHGGLLVVDSNRIVRIRISDGTVTTVAGTGDFGDAGDGGPASAAAIDPRDLAIGLLGDLYVADWRVRRIDARTGIITSVAGNGRRGAERTTTGDGGPALSAGLGYLNSGAVDALGNVYIAQAGEYADGHRIRRVDGVTATIETIAVRRLKSIAPLTASVGASTVRQI